MVPLCQNKCSYIQQCIDEDMCLYSQQCVEENTVLTQGRIILWAGGSLADDGSTVSKQVFLYSSVWMTVPILNRAGPRSDVEDMRQRRKSRKTKALSSEQHNGVFQWFQEYDDVFQWFQEYDDVFQWYQEYDDVFQWFQEFDDVFQWFQEFDDVFQWFQEFDGVFQWFQ